ncbi:hypothetical protein [Streptomyces pseudovenezuelae]|uniref:hypothetical protein n=1 Tax=Streptomyces pseudovenezuelae TaxID=67350 RepID=UPI0036E378ED
MRHFDGNGQLVTISDAISPLSAFGRQAIAARPGGFTPQGLPEVVNSIEFRLGPEHAPAQSMRRARGFVAKVLPTLLAGAPNAKVVEDATLAVLTELVDVTARHRASLDLSGRVSYDGGHVLITVGEMDRPLPAPEEEPGLFLVRASADCVGQHREGGGGYETWASIPVRSAA